MKRTAIHQCSGEGLGERLELTISIRLFSKTEFWRIISERERESIFSWIKADLEGSCTCSYTSYTCFYMFALDVLPMYLLTFLNTQRNIIYFHVVFVFNWQKLWKDMWLTCLCFDSMTPSHKAFVAPHFPSPPLNWFWICHQSHNTKCSLLSCHLYL